MRHRSDGELLLAAREVKVQRSLRRAATGDDLVDACAVVALPAQQRCRRLNESGSGRPAAALTSWTHDASITTGLPIPEERFDATAHLPRFQRARVARSARATPTLRRGGARAP